MSIGPTDNTSEQNQTDNELHSRILSFPGKLVGARLLHNTLGYVPSGMYQDLSNIKGGVKLAESGTLTFTRLGGKTE
jgi:hypothetical protein